MHLACISVDIDRSYLVLKISYRAKFHKSIFAIEMFRTEVMRTSVTSRYWICVNNLFYWFYFRGFILSLVCTVHNTAN